MFFLDNLNLTLNTFRLKNISININEGEYCIILGPSGSGKTVLLETIAGMHNLSSGRIIHNKEDISKLLPEERKIGFVYQNYELFPHLKVRENIGFGLYIKKESRQEIENKILELAKIFDIVEILDRYPKNLSGGEKQRVAIARAVILSPDILLLDEPLNALDIDIKPVLQRKLKDFHKKFKNTIIHVTHDIEEALYLGDKIAVMNKGELNIIKNKKDLTKKEYIKNNYFI